MPQRRKQNGRARQQPQRKRAPRRARNPPNRGNNNRQKLLPNAIANTVSNSRSGSDRVRNVEMIRLPFRPTGTTTAGTVIFDQMITAHLAPRMSLQARTWLNWQPMSLKASVVALNGATVKGGYVMAYIDDPSANYSTRPEDIIQLTAFGSSTIQQNWVQSSVKQSNNHAVRTLFTKATHDSDPRLYSPGRIVVMLTGDPGPDANWTLVLDYDVKFTNPGIDMFGIAPDMYDTSFTNGIVRTNGAQAPVQVYQLPIPARGSEPLQPNTMYIAQESSWRALWSIPNGSMPAMNAGDEVIGFITGSNLETPANFRFVIGPANQRVYTTSVAAAFSYEMFPAGVFFRRWNARTMVNKDGVPTSQCDDSVEAIREKARKAALTVLNRDEYASYIRSSQDINSLNEQLANVKLDFDRYKLANPVKQLQKIIPRNQIVKEKQDQPYAPASSGVKEHHVP